MKLFLARINAKQCTEVAQAARGAVRLQLRTTERDFGEAKKRNNFKKVAKETGHHPERAVTRLGSY